MKEIIFGIYIVIHVIVFAILIWRAAIKPLFTNIFDIFSNNSLAAEQNPVISQRQAAFLSVTLVISTADVFLPKFIAMDAGRNAWLAVVISGIELGLLLGIILYFLKKFPDKNFTMIVKDTFSPVISIPLLALWLLFLLQKASVTARELAEVVLHGFLTDTPIGVIELAVLIVTGYAVKKGLQPIARSNDFLLSIGVLTLFFVIFMLFSTAEMERFRPFLEDGIKPVIKGSFPSLPWITDIILLLCLTYPNIDDKKKVGKYFAGSVIFVIIALESGTLAIAIFGLSLTQEDIFPALEMVRAVRITDFLERLEVPLITVWISGIFIKLAFVYYAITDTVKIWWGLKNRFSVVWPVGFIVFGLCIQPFQNIGKILYCLHKIFPYYTIALYGLIIIVLAAATIKKKLSSNVKISSIGY